MLLMYNPNFSMLGVVYTLEKKSVKLEQGLYQV